MADELTKVAQDSTRGGFFLVSGNAFATVISAIGSILIARFLGPELYGQYALAFVAPQLLFLFTDLGINQAITKFTAALKSRGETNRITDIIKHGMLVRAVIGIAIFALTYGFAGAIAATLLQRPDLTFYVQIASTAILFQVIFTTATSAFVGLDKTEYQVVTATVQAIAKTIVSIALILAGLSVAGAIAGNTVSYVAAAVTSLPLLWLLLRKEKISSERDSFKTNLETLFQYGTPLYISVLLAGFLPLFNSMTLAFFTTDVAIGNYKAAINFATLLGVVAGPIATVLLPAFSKLNSASTPKIREFFKIAVKYTTIIITPITFLIIIFSSEIVQIIYGGTYQSASLFLSMYCLVYFLVGIGFSTLPSLYSGLGDTKTTLKMSLATFFTLILLAVPLTQAFSVQGLIVAFLIANTTGTLYGACKAKRKLRIEIDAKNIATIYLISAASCTIPILLKTLVSLPSILNLALGGMLYLLSYITLMPLTNAVTRSELQKITLATQNTPLLKQIAKPILNYQQKILKLKTKQKPHVPKP